MSIVQNPSSHSISDSMHTLESADPTSQTRNEIDPSMSVIDAIYSRRSVRGYLDKEVPADVLNRIFEVAQMAPSNCNVQPWKVYVVQGAAKDKLITEVCDAHNAMAANPAVARLLPLMMKFTRFSRLFPGVPNSIDRRSSTTGNIICL